MLEVGDKAPDFRLIGTSGNAVTLKELRGRKVVLYFYPRDDTPGCTREACAFRDNLARVREAGAEVFGVSKDSLSLHGRFRAKYELGFELLSDPDNAVASAYGAYGTKTMYGKKVQGTIRSTFLIDAKGKIAVVWSPVKVDGHVDQVLEALSSKVRPASRQAKARKQVPARKKTPARKKVASKQGAARKAARRPARKA